MSEQFYNNDGSDSSIFKARIREEDLTAKQKIDEIKRAADEFVRKVASKRHSYEQISEEVHTRFDGLLSEIESCVEENDSSDDEGMLKTIYGMIKNFFDALGISIKEPNLKIHLLKKEKDKNWLASIIKALCDKLRKLLGKIFKQNLNWDEALEKKIKELEEKLKTGGMSEEETIEVLEALRDLKAMKLKFQIAFASALLTNFFTLLEFDLGVAQAQEIAEEGHKRIEEVSSKEPEVKQAREGAEVEAKVNEENKKDVQPKNLERPLTDPREIKDGKEKPIIPPKPDPDLLRNLLENLKLEPEKFIEPKQQVEEKPKQAAVTAPPPAAPVQPAPVKVPEVKPVQLAPTAKKHSYKQKEDLEDPKVASDKTAGRVLKEKAQITKSTNEGKMDNICDDFLTQFTCAKEKNPNMNEQNVPKAKSMNEKVRSELGEINKVENVNCGRSM